MSEKMKKNELEDKDLENVTGGDDVELGGNHAVGTIKEGYCKYCDAIKTLRLTAVDFGFWPSGRGEMCNKWQCSDCQNENYYSRANGRLLQ